MTDKLDRCPSCGHVYSQAEYDAQDHIACPSPRVGRSFVSRHFGTVKVLAVAGGWVMWQAGVACPGVCAEEVWASVFLPAEAA